jgi:hypothetical protein
MMCNDAGKEDKFRAYEFAAKLWANANQTFWSMYSAMIVANSILLAAVGWLFQADDKTLDKDFLSILSFYVIPILGIVLCFFWLIMTIRTAEFRKYYALATREMEEKLQSGYGLHDVYKIFTEVGLLFKGESIKFEIRGEKEPIIVKMPYIARLRDTVSSYIPIGLFMVVHLIILFGRNYKAIAQFLGILD